MRSDTLFNFKKDQYMNTNSINSEWILLQNQFDSYEKHSLYIKLLSASILLAAELSGVVSMGLILLLGVLWLQDGIWKTYQSRIESRLLLVEKYISEDNNGEAFQFNSDFQKLRLTGTSLIREYLDQSIRPTVAFPHFVLLLILVVRYLMFI